MVDEKSLLKELRNMLYRGALGTQFEIQEELRKHGIDVTQSTISRCLKRLRATRTRERSGKMVYRLPQEPTNSQNHHHIDEMVISVEFNDSLIVVHTQPGAAARVAYYLDLMKPAAILGTIAGDDTIFVAPPAATSVAKVAKAVEKLLVSKK